MIRKLCLAAGLWLVLVGTGLGDAYPSRPIRWIVPYPPGGGTDTVSRPIAAKLSEFLGQPVVIENKPGGATIVGTAATAHAEADGYTFGLITDSHSINAAFAKAMPYDSANDFTPILQLIRVPLVLIVNAQDVPMNTLPELIRYANAHPGWFSFGSLGSGSPHELGFLWFKQLSKLDALVVPYRGTNAALQDTLAGHVKGTFVGAAVANELIKAGKVKPIAVTSLARLKSAPNIPTFAEQGYPGFEFVTWYGLVAPRGTPPDIIARLNVEISRALRAPSVAESISSAGGEPVGGSPEQFAKMLQDDIARYTDIVRRTDAKPD